VRFDIKGRFLLSVDDSIVMDMLDSIDYLIKVMLDIELGKPLALLYELPEGLWARIREVFKVI